MTASNKLKLRAFTLLMTVVVVGFTIQRDGVLFVVQCWGAGVLGRLRGAGGLSSCLCSGLHGGLRPGLHHGLCAGVHDRLRTGGLHHRVCPGVHHVQQRLVSGPLPRSRESRDLGATDDDVLRADLHRGLRSDVHRRLCDDCLLRRASVQLVLGQLCTGSGVQHLHGELRSARVQHLQCSASYAPACSSCSTCDACSASVTTVEAPCSNCHGVCGRSGRVHGNRGRAARGVDLRNVNPRTPPLTQEPTPALPPDASVPGERTLREAEKPAAADPLRTRTEGRTRRRQRDQPASPEAVRSERSHRFASSGPGLDRRLPQGERSGSHGPADFLPASRGGRRRLDRASN